MIGSNKPYPYPIEANLDGITSLGNYGVAYCETAFAIQTGGLLYGWGRNDWGQVGDGCAPTDRVYPARIIGISDVRRVCCRGMLTAAIAGEGDLYLWGQLPGRRDDDSYIEGPTPSVIKGLPAIADVYVDGTGLIFALGKDGSVWAWNYVLPKVPPQYVTTPKKLPAFPPTRQILRFSTGTLYLVSTTGDVWTASLDTEKATRFYNLANISKLTADAYCVFALCDESCRDGHIWYWGANNWGEFANGTNNPNQVVTTPTQLNWPKP